MAAEYAGADRDTVAALEEMAVEYGVARQLSSDILDLAMPERSRDLASGVHTWPIAWCVEQIEGAERERLLTLLERARTCRDARRECGARMNERGALIRASLESELAIGRAERALARAKIDEGARAALREMLTITARRLRPAA